MGARRRSSPRINTMRGFSKGPVATITRTTPLLLVCVRATHLAEGAEFVLKILFGIRDGVLLSLPRLCDLFCKNCGQS